jgi:arylsulfatase A-like enzyme
MLLGSAGASASQKNETALDRTKSNPRFWGDNTTVSRTTPAPRTLSEPQLAPHWWNQSGISALNVLLVSIWCGLIAGLLEVGAREACRALHPTNRLYWMSRHSVWLTPLANILLFSCLGLAGAAITKLWPRRGRWLSFRILCALSLLPTLIVAVPGIFTEAWLIFALGIASLVVPWLEDRHATMRSLFRRSFVVLVVVAIALAASEFGGDWLKRHREAGRDLPPSGCPNVLFIVLDTVRADRLSLYGYQRPTTPTLERMAKRGVRFDRACAPSPWTLASHASFFSGRWPHELGVKWATPLRTGFPMLAEYLGARGYATAGFVANTNYCSSETGLDRGFTYYEDYVFEKLGFLRTAALVEEVLRTLDSIGTHTGLGPILYFQEWAQSLLHSGGKKDAASINRGFLDWLAQRPQSGRPFFAFLNYYDAHAPYRLPDGAPHHFGLKPRTRDEIRIVNEVWDTVDKQNLPRHYLMLGRDAYDNCLAYLDERLGLLVDELQRQGVLDRTLVVITSDHGEGLGEHDLFDHGESLYNNEIRVPLLILMPSATGAEKIVHSPVSLRDLPATIVELIGLNVGAPFTGRSLSSLWTDSALTAPENAGDRVISELSSPNPHNSNFGRSPIHRGPLISLAEGDFVYIQNQGDRTEELFNEREDPRELTNRAHDERLKPVLERFRQTLSRVKLQSPGVPR